MIKLDITVTMEDGTHHVAKVRMTEVAAFGSRFGQNLGTFLAEYSAITQSAGEMTPDRLAAGLDASYRLCWLAWKALHRAGTITAGEDAFLAAIDEYGVAEVPPVNPSQPAQTPTESSSSPSSPALLPPPGAST